MKKILLAILAIALLAGFAHAATSITSSVSPSTITQGSTAVVTATVSATGETETNVQVQITATSGITIGSSTTQTISSITAGSSQSVSWTVTGAVASADPYTITTTITGGSSSQAYLTVNSPALISTSNFSCNKTSMVYTDTVSMTFTVENNGGTETNVQVTTSATKLSLSSGTASWSSDVNGGGSAALNYTFTGSSTNCGTAVISSAITSNSNNPDDLSCSVTITGCPAADPGGGSWCGDNSCNGTETCSSCSADCGTCGASAGGGGGGGGGSGSSSADENTIGEEILLEKTFSGKPTAEEIATLLREVGASENAIEKASAAMNKSSAERKVVAKKKANGDYETTFTIKVKNNGKKKLLNVKIIESIPKAIAQSAGEIKSGSAFTILKNDPIIQFNVDEIAVGGAVNITYTLAKNVTEEMLTGFLSPAIGEVYEEQTRVIDKCLGVVCNDNSACTTDSCSKATGKCSYTSNGTCAATGKKDTTAAPISQKTGEWLPLIPIGIIVIVAIVAGYLIFLKKKQVNPFSNSRAKK